MHIGKTFTLITGFKTLSCATSFIIYFLWNVEEEKRNKLKRFSSIILYSIASGMQMQTLGKCIATQGPVAHTTNNYINTTYNLSDTSASLNHVLWFRKILQYGYLHKCDTCFTIQNIVLGYPGIKYLIFDTPYEFRHTIILQYCFSHTI